MNLACCKNISGQGVTILCNLCKYLKVLELRGCNRILNLELNSVSLILLNLSNCINLNNSSICSIQCPNLNQLYLSGCNAIDDISINSLLSKSKHISILDLSYCNIIDPLLVNLDKLSVLYLTGCSKLSPSFFSKLSTFSHCLKEVDLKGTSSTLDDCIDMLTRSIYLSKSIKSTHLYSSTIETINLSRCTNITSISIQYLTERCSNLKYLDISWCVNITDLSLLYISHYNSTHYPNGLDTLKIFGCSQLTTNAIQNLQHTSPKLTIKCIMVRDNLKNIYIKIFRILEIGPN